MAIKRKSAAPAQPPKTEADEARELDALSDRELHDRIKFLVAMFFGFFTVCDNRRCRREQACRGDPSQCFARCLPLLPEDALERWGKEMDCVRAGLSAEEMVRIADEHMARIAAARAAGDVQPRPPSEWVTQLRRLCNDGPVWR